MNIETKPTEADLAMVKEVQTLRATNERLQNQLDRIIHLANGPAYQGIHTEAALLAQDIIEIAVECREGECE